MKIIQFNGLHIVLIILSLITGILGMLYFNRFEKADKISKIKKMSIIGLALLVIRLLWIIFDKKYQYNFFAEWIFNPVELIVIASFLVYVGKKIKLMPIIYYFGIIWSIIAIFFPDSRYLGSNIFAVRNLLYYTLLYFNLIICLFTSTIYKPNKKDIIPTIQLLFITITVAFCLNVLLKFTLLNKSANYFYTVQPQEIRIFNFIYQMIPIGYVYYLVVIILMWLCFYLLYACSIWLAKPINKLKLYLNRNIRWTILNNRILKKQIY